MWRIRRWNLRMMRHTEKLREIRVNGAAKADFKLCRMPVPRRTARCRFICRHQSLKHPALG